MIRWIRHWFVLRKAERLYEDLIKSESVSLRQDFLKRVQYFAKMLSLQFGEKVIVRFDGDCVYLVHRGLAVAELVLKNDDCARYAYIMVSTSIKPIPQWWLGLAFTGIKWTAACFPDRPQLTYAKPREN